MSSSSSDSSFIVETSESLRVTSEEDSNRVVTTETSGFSIHRCDDAADDTQEDSMSAIFGEAKLFSRTNSPIHWATLSDTIAVSPAGLPILNVVRFASATIDSATTYHHDGTGGNLHYIGGDRDLNHHQAAHRCRSVPDMTEEKLKHSDEDFRQMRHALLNLAKSRALFRELGRHQKWALAAICIVYFSSFCAISVLSPFFHHVAVEHGISTSTYGLIFAIHPLVVFCTSPFIGQLIPSIGPKFMFVSGVFLCGSCNLLFAALDLVEDDTKFLILCFAVRGLAAVGASAFSTAGATFVADLFPDKISAVMGILETFIGLGFSIGPVIGGALYTLGGFQLPFYVLGSVMILTIPFNLWILPASEDGRGAEKMGMKAFTVFKMPAVIIICLVVAVSSSAWSVLEPTLVIHMQQFDLTAFHLGLLFLLTSASYALSSPIWGWLNDKYDHGHFMMVVGLSVTALSLLLLGPSPVLPNIPNTLWLNIVSLILLGIFDSLAYLPTYHALLHYAVKAGWKAELTTYSTIAGLWASMYSLGEVIGPSLGTFLVELYDFPSAMTAIGLMNLSVAALLLFHQTVVALLKRRRSINNDQPESHHSSATQHVVQKFEAVIASTSKQDLDEKSPLLYISEEFSGFETVSG